MRLKPEPTTLAEQEAILTRAGHFDRLLNEQGWIEVQEYLAEQINSAIIEAAGDDPMEAEEQRLHVIMWNAKRSLNDGLIAWINQTRAERDRLLKEQQEEEELKRHVYSTTSYSGPI